MKNKLICVCLLVLLASVATTSAEIAPEKEWDKTFGGANHDSAYSVQQTADGGYILAGWTASYGAGESDFWLVKTNSNGNKEWDKTFGGTDRDGASSVQQTADGGYILAGTTNSYGSGYFDFWLVKTDSNGNKEWDKTFDGTGGPVASRDEAQSVLQTVDGGYILAGRTSSDDGYSDFWLVKTDSNGNKEWDKTFGLRGTLLDEEYSVHQTADGGYILAGNTFLYGAGGSDFWLAKTDADGNKEWDKTFGGIAQDEAAAVLQTVDGGYILAGFMISYILGPRDFWLVKTDADGNKQWDKTFGGTDLDTASSVQQTTDGGYILAGTTNSYGGGHEDFWLVKTDADGNKQWDKTFGGTGWDEPNSVQQTADGGYILAGRTKLYKDGDWDFRLIKVEGDTGSGIAPSTPPVKPEQEEGNILLIILVGGAVLITAPVLLIFKSRRKKHKAPEKKPMADASAAPPPSEAKPTQPSALTAIPKPGSEPTPAPKDISELPMSAAEPTKEPTAIEIKRGYEVLQNNDLRFGIRIINNTDSVIMDVETILAYPKTLFSLKDNVVQTLANIDPHGKRTAKYILTPLGCIHNEKIDATITYKDHTGEKQAVQMRPKEVHCVCPFLKEKAMREGEFAELANASEYTQEGLSFSGIGVNEIAAFIKEACAHRLYVISEHEIDTKKIVYFAGESIGEKAYYLLTAVIQPYKNFTQVALRAYSDKSYGLHGFLNEIGNSIRHLVGSVQSAKEIGIIENKQVINIIDSVVWKTEFGEIGAGGGGIGATSVNIKDSVVQRSRIGSVRRCSNCGKEVQGDEKFCKECGARVG